MYREVRAFSITSSSKSGLFDNAVSPVLWGGRGLKQTSRFRLGHAYSVSPVLWGGRGLKLKETAMLALVLKYRPSFGAGAD